MLEAPPPLLGGHSHLRWNDSPARFDAPDLAASTAVEAGRAAAAPVTSRWALCLKIVRVTRIKRCGYSTDHQPALLLASGTLVCPEQAAGIARRMTGMPAVKHDEFFRRHPVFTTDELAAYLALRGGTGVRTHHSLPVNPRWCVEHGLPAGCDAACDAGPARCCPQGRHGRGSGRRESDASAQTCCGWASTTTGDAPIRS